jgi:hypothetical protein
VSTFGGVPKKAPSSISKPKVPTSLMGVAKAVCQTPLFFMETMAILSIQPTVMSPLVKIRQNVTIHL